MNTVLEINYYEPGIQDGIQDGRHIYNVYTLVIFYTSFMCITSILGLSMTTNSIFMVLKSDITSVYLEF